MNLARQSKIMALKALCRVGLTVESWFDGPRRPERVGRILVFQNGGMGDVLRIFPLLEALHRAYPDARLDVLVEPHQEVFALFPWRHVITNFLVIDYGGDHKTWRGRLPLVRELRRRRYDLTISPNRGRGMMASALLSFLAGAPYRVGFTRDGSGFLYTTRVGFQADRSIIEQNLDLLRAVGIPCGGAHMPLRVPEADDAAAEALLAQHGVEHGDLLVAVSPGTGWQPEFRSWPVSRYVDLVRALVHRSGTKVLLLGGRDQADASVHFAVANDGRVINAIGQTSIARTAGLIRRSDLFIGNDSGLLHLAMGLKIPAIGIFGSTPPEQILTPDSPCMAVVRNDVPCRPCYTHQAVFTLECDHFSCLRLISVNDVLQAAERMLASPLQPSAVGEAHR
ncbi:MAG TPA: glycosyltransferase family 9 protein [Candidatus Acidoferrum sp.]|nr:glycosyltransferase family 9 protein [Candidatus Methylomirabilis sp.]HWU41325.1 glycosyltransferase family 9 protein [Candidatus Acidoferrum sp.]